MKIGIVLSNPPGYSETFFTSKIKGLQDSGMEVILFVQYQNVFKNAVPPLKGARGMSYKINKAPKVYKNYPFLQAFLIGLKLFTLIPYSKTIYRFIRLERNDKSSWPSIIKKTYLNSHILKQKVDWLHFGFATQALGSELVAKAIGAKMAVSFRGFDINVYPVKFPNCYNKVWKNVDKVHSISNYLLQKAYSLGLSKEVPFKIITPAVNIKEIPKSKSQIPTSIKETVKIVTVARLNWIKGVDIAINAMRILKNKKIDFEFDIIGGWNGKDIERYQYQVYQLGLEDVVTFCGKLSHKDTLQKMDKASTYLQPSLNEGFCNAVLEAQALEKLCITSDVGGLTENIENNKSGWLVPKNNPQALANKIIEIVHLPERKKQEIAYYAQERVKKYFTIEQQQKQFVEFYK